jgi:sec-independent protein translocase protein TatC
MYFTLIFVGGIIVAFPYIFWEFWRFIKPGIDKKRIIKNKRCYFLGFTFIFPGNIIRLLCHCSLHSKLLCQLQLDENIENRWTITSYIDTLVPLILGTGLAFQLPLVMFFLAKVGLMSP